jgi:hypothetical protein
MDRPKPDTASNTAMNSTMICADTTQTDAWTAKRLALPHDCRKQLDMRHVAPMSLDRSEVAPTGCETMSSGRQPLEAGAKGRWPCT